MEEWAKEARARLSIGDMCPVCGQKIEVLSKDEDFQSMLAPIRQSLEAKEKKIQGSGTSIKQQPGRGQNLREYDSEQPSGNRKRPEKVMILPERKQKSNAVGVLSQASPTIPKKYWKSYFRRIN